MKALSLLLLLCVFSISPVTHGGEDKAARAPVSSTSSAEMTVAPVRSTVHKGSSGMAGGLDVSASCCQAPGPNGLHCCDTRDCGWFNCNDMKTGKKLFKK
ncbi:MAG: hypothetical protein V7711_13090 [Pseudomonadales bacterium]